MMQSEPLWRCRCGCDNIGTGVCVACGMHLHDTGWHSAVGPTVISITDVDHNIDRMQPTRLTFNFNDPDFWTRRRPAPPSRKPASGLSPAERERRIAAARRQSAARKATRRHTR